MKKYFRSIAWEWICSTLIPQFRNWRKAYLRSSEKKKDEPFGWIQDLVGWWLYDDVGKKIWHEEVEFNVESVEDFTDYLIREYGSDNIPTN